MNYFLQLLVLQLFITQSFAQVSSPRKALIIGNAQYPDRPLKNPVHDAQKMAEFLGKNGFTVTLKTNLGWSDMDDAQRAFISSLQEGDISLFFFSGHGEERDKINYLCPIPEQGRNDLFNLKTFLSRLEQKKCFFSLVMLDACRINPATTKSAYHAFTTNNLVLHNKLILSFAAQPGSPSYDSYDNNSDLSPYTASFLNIVRDGASLNDIFPRLVDSVLAKTMLHTPKQQPSVNHSMSTEIAKFKLLLPEAFPMKKVSGLNEQPSFSIGQHEVTQAEWQEIMGENPAFNKCYDCPIENVYLADIQLFIKKLNDKTGKKYRLCTEVEWEYAACGGNLTPIYRYSGSDDLNAVGWYLENAAGKTHPVKQKQENRFGIYDMSGNVWEWCRDANGVGVLRGGSLGQEKDSRLQNRFQQDSTVKSRYYGFRLCED
jgi:hypothetical protein